jgi:predicted ABC-type exoprotein transport system permease subunit
MQHLEIAYELLVILIGLAALAISFSWMLRTREADLRNFCLVYALFTAALLISVVEKYLP